MKDVYRGREQTYFKHFFLEQYLERVAYIIGSTHRGFVYVDAFSGPWESGDEKFEDTSFMIAIQMLRRVKQGLIDLGRPAEIRCLFVEKDPQSFSALERAISDVTDLEIKTIPGEFVSAIPEILSYVGRTFSLTFIDPTGWTGFPLQEITPILRHAPGEVLINFMYDYYVRFNQTNEHKHAFTAMMGGPGFENLNEEETIALYCERIQRAGGFEFATSTRMKKATAERSYFHLVYGTRHLRGLEKFREVEKKEIRVQEQVRLEAKDLESIARTAQPLLFGAGELPGRSSFEDEFIGQHRKAGARLDALLNERGRVSYEIALGQLLSMPLVWEDSVQQLIRERREAGRLEIEGLKTRERTVKKGCELIRKS